MFNGIIQETGTIKTIEEKKDGLKMIIKSPGIAKNLNIGESVCINGICTTITAIESQNIIIDFMQETINKTTVKNWRIEEKLNMEPSMNYNDRINGHFVSGHVDAIGKIVEISISNDFSIEFPDEISKYIALKGSVSVDGISLTVSYLDTNIFGVAIIPHTLEITNLKYKKPGDFVNIEIDLITRYLKRLFDERDKQSTYEFLQERGFI